MVILIAGASGFIGSSLATACVLVGHTVICASRDGRAPGLPGTRLLRFDYAAMPPVETLRDMLAGVDVVVNAVTPAARFRSAALEEIAGARLCGIRGRPRRRHRRPRAPALTHS